MDHSSLARLRLARVVIVVPQMRKTTRRLELKRVTIAGLGRANGSWHVASYDEGCSQSCNTCDDQNGLCWWADDTDLCETVFCGITGTCIMC